MLTIIDIIMLINILNLMLINTAKIVQNLRWLVHEMTALVAQTCLLKKKR